MYVQDQLNTIVTKVLDVLQDIINTEPNVFRTAQMAHMQVTLSASTVILTVLLVLELQLQIASDATWVNTCSTVSVSGNEIQGPGWTPQTNLIHDYLAMPVERLVTMALIVAVSLQLTACIDNPAQAESVRQIDLLGMQLTQFTMCAMYATLGDQVDVPEVQYVAAELELSKTRMEPALIVQHYVRHVQTRHNVLHAQQVTYISTDFAQYALISQALEEISPHLLVQI